GDANAPDRSQRQWRSALFKTPVESAVSASATGLAGDGQADLENHGGVDMAINVYPREHFDYWTEKLQIQFPAGAFGENFSTRGMTEESTCIGDTYGVGDIVVQVSQPRKPCWKIARRWQVKDLAAQVERTGLTGWYLRVLEEGAVGAPAAIRLLDRPHPEWSIAAVNEIMYRRKDDAGQASQLGSCPALSEGWRQVLLRRAETLLGER
ncbi:MAG: MOSC domain-containing protein, partial [Verrucomicrobiales bacterium]